MMFKYKPLIISLAFLAPISFAAPTDTDGDGVNDVFDLDDDNDGILDVTEGCGLLVSRAAPAGDTVNIDSNTSFDVTPVQFLQVLPGFYQNQITQISPGDQVYARTAVNIGDEVVTYTFNRPVPTNQIGFYVYDVDAYQDIQITVTGGTATTSDFQTINSGALSMTWNSVDGTGAHVVNPGANIIEQNNTLFIYGESDATIQSITVRTADINTSDTPAADSSVGNFIGTTLYYKELNDTDGDGVPDCLELDSDNDGCLDVVEGGGVFEISDSVVVDAPGGVIVGTGKNLGNSVDSDGIPIATTTEQRDSAGESTNPARTTITTAVAPQNVLEAQDATFSVVAQSLLATQYNASGEPDFNNNTSSVATIYQWQTSTNGTTWTDIVGEVSASLTLNAVTSAIDGSQYRVIVSCVENACEQISNAATLTVLRSEYNMVKTVDETNITSPTTLIYTFTFTNNGDVALNNLTVNDATIDANSLTCNGDADSDGDIDSLVVGATQTCTATRGVTQADINSGSDIINTATVTATDPSGNSVTEIDTTDNTATTTISQTTGLVLTKASSTATDTNGDTIIGVGDEITYTFTVKNTGNVALTNVLLNDAKLGLTGAVCVPNLGVNEELQCSGSYTYILTQEDVNSGKVQNTATATGKDPSNNDVTDVSDSTNPNDTGTGNDDPTTTPITISPSISLTKESSTAIDTNGDTIIGVGDKITYTFTVKNTGNVALTNVLLNDAKLGLTGAVCVPNLGVNEELQCSGSYTYILTQEDVNSGEVQNTATATGKDPSNNDVTDVSDSTNPNDTGANDDHDSDGNNSNDPTRTPINSASGNMQPKQVPSISVFGLMVLFASMMGAILSIRRKN